MCTEEQRQTPLRNSASRKSIVEVKTEQNCLAHALVIAITKVDNDPNYKAYRQGRKIRPVALTLFETIGIYLFKGAGIPKLVRFQEYFREYKIIVYHCLRCEDIIFKGQVSSMHGGLYGAKAIPRAEI